MSDMNIATFSGIIGRDPEYKTGSNWQRLSFSIANNTGWGEKKKTQWIKVTIWGKKAEVMSRFLKAKYKVGVWGVVTTRAYTDRDGQPQASLELDCRECEILSQSSRGASGGASDPDGDGAATPSANPAPANDPGFDPNDAPF